MTEAIKLVNVYTGEVGYVYPSPVEWLHQDKEWRNSKGVVVPIENISPAYANNIRCMLLQRAASLHRAEIRHLIDFIEGPLGPSGDMGQDAAQRELAELCETDPVQWLEGTELMQALKRRTGR